MAPDGRYVFSRLPKIRSDRKTARMTRWTIGKQLTGGFGLLVLLLCCIAGIGVFCMRRASQAMSEIAVQHLSEMQLATAFEREILNARIHFIYHVTIQKPGALEAGWDRF